MRPLLKRKCPKYKTKQKVLTWTITGTSETALRECCRHAMAECYGHQCPDHLSYSRQTEEPGAEVFRSPTFLGALQGPELNRDFLLPSDLLRFCQIGQKWYRMKI